MPTSGSATGARWAIILAGGEGERMRPLTTRWFGRHQPKQYCAFVGSRSMLQHTLDRATCMVDADRIITVIGRGHRALLDRACRLPLPGRFVEQPANYDTAPGIFLPTTYVLEADPSATVLIFPSDHFIFPEERFLQHVRRAALLAEELDNRLVLLGATPRWPEVEYGWVETGPPISALPGPSAKSVTSFYEKPSGIDAKRFYCHGYLWNTMIMAVKVKTLWSLGQRFFPEMMARFEALRHVLRLVHSGAVGKEHEVITLSHIYHNLRFANFSRDVLQRAAETAAILEMDDVEWDDWGSPDRIVQSLARLDKCPSFSIQEKSLATG